MPFLVRGRKTGKAQGKTPSVAAQASLVQKASVQKLAKTHSRSDVAGFLLAPIQRPDFVMEVLMDRMRSDGFLIPRAQAIPGPAARSHGARIAVRLSAIISIFMFLSCAIAPNNGINLAAIRGTQETIEPLSNAIAAGFQSAGMLLQGDSLPSPLAGTFAGRLLSGNWSGIMLIGPNGETKAIANNRQAGELQGYVARQERLEDENLLLNETIAAIRNTEQTNKVYLEINLEDNRLRVKQGTNTLYEFPIVTGKGYSTRESGHVRRFATPRGILKVQEKERNPIWHPPAWHWTERGQTPPAYRPGVPNHLGKYRLVLGDGIGIHGTPAGRISPGKLSHGCIRMNATDLETVFKISDVGTEVYIY